MCLSPAYLQHTGATAHSNTFVSGRGGIFLNYVGCTGTESSLLSCSNRGIGVHNCKHYEDVGVRCSGMVFNDVVSLLTFVLLCLYICVHLYYTRRPHRKLLTTMVSLLLPFQSLLCMPLCYIHQIAGIYHAHVTVLAVTMTLSLCLSAYACPQILCACTYLSHLAQVLTHSHASSPCMHEYMTYTCKYVKCT